MLNHELPRTADCRPPRTGSFVPINVHEWSFAEDELVSSAKAVVVDFANVVNGYVSIAGAKLLATTINAKVLTNDPSFYRMLVVYPETYRSMTTVPDPLITDDLTSMQGMFGYDDVGGRAPR